MTEPVITEITGRLSYLKGESDPLSADIGIIRGDSRTWYFDAGAGDHAFHLISEDPGEKAIILSHFHTDHTENLKRLSGDIPIYIGKFTAKYTNPENLLPPPRPQTIIESDLYIRDGVSLHLFPLPCSHAKGSIGLEIDETWAFLGDAIYPKLVKDDPRGVYNKQLLIEEIRVLRSLKARYVLLSHKPRFVQEKAAILIYLEGILKKLD